MLEETVRLRELIKGVLLSALVLPEVWGDDAIDGWASTNDICTVIAQEEGVAGGYYKIYPNLRALAKRGEIWWWKANETLPTDGVPTVEALVKYGQTMQARWRLVPSRAPTHDVEALEQWLTS